jgi:3-mercaptopyruvate sulfurtransferase SseA
MMRAEPRIKRVLVYSVILITGILTHAYGGGPDHPTWLHQAREDAKKDGYELITAPELKTLYESGKDVTIVDVRPEYEYRNGHIANARSLEFDLGDKLELKPDKQKVFIDLLGPDKQRQVVFYCRSFA